MERARIKRTEVEVGVIDNIIDTFIFVFKENAAIVISLSALSVSIFSLYSNNKFKKLSLMPHLSADLTVTSTVTWTDATSFSDATIGKGESIMVRIDQLTSKPVALTFNIFGYLTE